jgi:hypothetical protein
MHQAAVQEMDVAVPNDNEQNNSAHPSSSQDEQQSAGDWLGP